jgi:hypothetical protein
MTTPTAETTLLFFIPQRRQRNRHEERVAHQEAALQETVTFKGTIIGDGQRVECEVRATKTTLAGDPPLISGYWIVESDVTDALPDGNYELLVNRERTRFRREAGRFLSRPY